MSKPKSPLMVRERELEDGEFEIVASETTVAATEIVSVNRESIDKEIKSSVLQAVTVNQKEISDMVIAEDTQQEGDGWSIVSPGKGS